MASVDEVLNDMPAADALAEPANVEYIIDNELRIITVPPNGVVLGVEGDKDVNTIHFKMARYYRGLDLSAGFDIRVTYVNAKAELGYFTVTQHSATDDAIMFEWVVGSHAMMYVGDIKFAVSLIKSTSAGQIEKKFNTTIGSAQCLTGLDLDQDVSEEQKYGLLTQIKNDVMADIQPFLDSAEQNATQAAASAQASESKANEAAQNASKAKASQDAASESAKQAKVSQDASKSNADVSTQAANESMQAANKARTIASELEERILWMQYDEASGRYTNASIKGWLRGKRDGLAYGVEIPKSNIVKCTKIGANQGVAVPTPGKIGTPAIDPYVTIGGPFFYMEVNGGCEISGVPYVVAVNGDGNFSRSHADEDTCILSPVLYTREEETDTTIRMYISDTKLPGYEPEAGAVLPDGSLRPYMLRAKYPLSKDANGRPRSTSGLKPLIRSVSHNSLIDLMKNKTTGYSGKTQNDEWYVKIMFLMKYATKNSQKYFGGCSWLNRTIHPTVAEQNVTRVIVSKSDAEKIPVGSSMMFGTNPSGNQANPTSFNIFDSAKVLSISSYDDNNSSIAFDNVPPFSTETTYSLFNTPWMCGACDSVSGDGSPTNPTGDQEPFTIQGIELGHGMYEILGNVILSNKLSNHAYTGWKVYVNPDSQKESTSRTSDYVDTGINYGDKEHRYPQYPKTVNGLMLALGDNATDSFGICDSLKLDRIINEGDREWLSLGYMGSSNTAGLWLVNGVKALNAAEWYIGSRRSYIGRTNLAM